MRQQHRLWCSSHDQWILTEKEIEGIGDWDKVFGGEGTNPLCLNCLGIFIRASSCNEYFRQDEKSSLAVRREDEKYDYGCQWSLCGTLRWRRSIWLTRTSSIAKGDYLCRERMKHNHIYRNSNLVHRQNARGTNMRFTTLVASSTVLTSRARRTEPWSSRLSCPGHQALFSQGGPVAAGI